MNFKVISRTNEPASSGSRLLLAAVLCSLLILPGCGESTEEYRYSDHLIDLPDESSMKLGFVVDERRKKLAVHILDAETRTPKAVSESKLESEFTISDETLTLTFDADPMPKDPAGHSSRFSIDFDELPEQLFGVSDFDVMFSLNFEGQEISGNLQHRDDHTHDGHD